MRDKELHQNALDRRSDSVVLVGPGITNCLHCFRANPHSPVLAIVVILIRVIQGRRIV